VFYIFAFLCLLVANAAVLAICLSIANSIVGGIEFGSARVALTKAAILLLLISALELIPFGIGIALPVWWGSMMYLFRLDLRAMRPLVVVNLGCSLLIQFFMLLPFIVE
jgi:hypothetical protein